LSDEVVQGDIYWTAVCLIFNNLLQKMAVLAALGKKYECESYFVGSIILK
jgi:hypothetical protein